jgi:hypothetical protein
MRDVLGQLVFDPELICVHLHGVCLVQSVVILKVWTNNLVTSVAVTFERRVTLLSLIIVVFVTGRERSDGDSVFAIAVFGFLPVGEGETINRLFEGDAVGCGDHAVQIGRAITQDFDSTSYLVSIE